MNSTLPKYVKTARAKGHSDEKIKTALVTAGWDPKMVTSCLAGEDDLPVPPPPTTTISDSPRSVVQTFSTHGLEYIIMLLSLGFVATSLGAMLHSSVNSTFGSTDSSVFGADSSFSTAALIVSLPLFIYLFYRLHKHESSDPSLLMDLSRKRAIQLTLIITFLVGMGNIIYFVYTLLGSSSTDTSSYNFVGSQASTNVLGNFIHLAITLVIAGGIFVYYWRDQHTQG